MDFIAGDLQLYAENHTSKEPSLLHKINRHTHLHVLKPRMLSGHLQGRFLSMISKLINPENILEIGTYTGYATLCLAEGLSPSGKIISIENNPEVAALAKKNFCESKDHEKIQLIQGDASKIIDDLHVTFDLVFIDADKDNYLLYYKKILPKVRTGGVILADNVLWSGKITDPLAQDKDTKALRAFNDFVQEDDSVENILLPIRDGISWIIKR